MTCLVENLCDSGIEVGRALESSNAPSQTLLPRLHVLGHFAQRAYSPCRFRENRYARAGEIHPDIFTGQGKPGHDDEFIGALGHLGDSGSKSLVSSRDNAEKHHEIFHFGVPKNHLSGLSQQPRSGYGLRGYVHGIGDGSKGRHDLFQFIFCRCGQVRELEP